MGHTVWQKKRDVGKPSARCVLEISRNWSSEVAPIDRAVLNVLRLISALVLNATRAQPLQIDFQGQL